MRRIKSFSWFLIFGFLLGIHQGKIALWEGDDPEPIAVFPYSAETLPQADQMRLRNGIRIETKDQLIQMIENYCS